MGVGASVKGASSNKLKVDSNGRTSVSWEAFRSHSGDKIFGNLYMLQTIVGMQNKTNKQKHAALQSSCVPDEIQSMTSARPCNTISVPVLRVLGSVRLSLSSSPSNYTWPGYAGT